MVASGQRMHPVRLLWRRALIVLVLLCIVVLAFAVYGLFWKERDARKLQLEAKAQLKELTTEHDNLAAQIASLKTDRGKEEVLRGQYTVGHPGEEMMIIVNNTSSATVTAPTSSPDWWENLFLWW